MAQKFMKTQEVADYLGLSPADVNALRESHQLHAYRDGADWKFKAEEIEAYAQSQKAGAEEPPAGQDEADVLLSEAELGESDPSTSGTVIGPPDKAAAPSESDIQLGGSDLKLGSSGLALGGSDIALAGSGVKGKNASKGSELDLTLDDDLGLEDSQLRLEGADAGKVSGGSGKKNAPVTDEDVVLGGSGSGSDITIGGDSGISLVDPADSGLSLEDPLDVGGSDESLELGEDDMLSLADDSETDAPAELKADDDFLLTPLEEGSEEDSESGSQVIALDGDVASDEGATMIAHAPGAGSAAMLDEDLSAAAGVTLGSGIGGAMGSAVGMGSSIVGPTASGIGAFGPSPVGVAAPMGSTPAMDPAFAAQAGLPEAPYSVLSIVGLASCILVLMLGGMMSYDLLRNMWSWNAPYTVNSSLMDWILRIIG